MRRKVSGFGDLANWAGQSQDSAENPNDVQTAYTNFLKNDSSNGRAIFIPVHTTNGPKEEYCTAADGTGSFILGDTANQILERAGTEGVTTLEAAIRVADERLAHGRR